MATPLFFSTFEVTRQAFHRTSLTYAIVNLKPIVPGRTCARVLDAARPAPCHLRADELAELTSSVQRVGRVVERAYKADGLTIALQDGAAAGQTVPHVHFHILPRRLRDDRFSDSRRDEVYAELEKQEGGIPRDLAAASKPESQNDHVSPEPLRVDADDARKPRTLEDMEQEARWLAGFFEAEG